MYNIKKYEVDTKYNLKIIWSYLKKDKKRIALLFTILIVIEILAFFDNFLLKFLIDKGADLTANIITKTEFLHFLSLIVVVFFSLRGVFNSLLWYVKIRVFNRLEGKFMNNLEKDSFWHVMNLSYRYHINKKTGSIISQFTRGVGKVESLLDAIWFNFFPVIIRIVLSVGVILYFDFRTSVALFIMVVAYIIFGFWVTGKQKVPQNDTNYQEDILKQNLSDVFLNIETVKYFGKEKRTQGYFSGLSKKLKKARIVFWDYFSWYVAIQTVILIGGISAIVYLSFSGFAEGNLTIGSITLIYASIWKLLPYLHSLMHGYRQFIRSNIDVTALFEMFKEKNEVVDVPEAKKLKVKKGEVEYKNIHFAYPQTRGEAFGIGGLNLKIKPNTKVAFMGPSGGGKSTMVKLLYRLFDLNKGKILIDGQDISLVDQESLRNSMSIVPQEPILFDNTIFFNVAYANPKASKEKVWEAIKFAQLDKLIEKLPKKEKTIVGERGIKLSGGEKQRVSIARAILADKKILVLDEATSALDSETEKEIQKDLEKLMVGRTTIMIAHRLSTIMKADVIVALREGKIVEVGSHQDLTKKKGGLYRRLWNLQQGL